MFLHYFLGNYTASEATQPSRYDDILFDKNHFYCLSSGVKHKQRAFFAALWSFLLSRGVPIASRFFWHKNCGN